MLAKLNGSTGRRRQRTVEKIGVRGTPEAFTALIDIAFGSANLKDVEPAQRALAAHGAKVVPIVAVQLADPRRRAKAAELLIQIRSIEAAPYLVAHLDDSDCLNALKKLGTEETVAPLLKRLSVVPTVLSKLYLTRTLDAINPNWLCYEEAMVPLLRLVGEAHAKEKGPVLSEVNGLLERLSTSVPDWGSSEFGSTFVESFLAQCASSEDVQVETFKILKVLPIRATDEAIASILAVILNLIDKRRSISIEDEVSFLSSLKSDWAATKATHGAIEGLKERIVAAAAIRNHSWCPDPLTEYVFLLSRTNPSELVGLLPGLFASEDDWVRGVAIRTLIASHPHRPYLDAQILSPELKAQIAQAVVALTSQEKLGASRMIDLLECMNTEWRNRSDVKALKEKFSEALTDPGTEPSQIQSIVGMLERIGDERSLDAMCEAMKRFGSSAFERTIERLLSTHGNRASVESLKTLMRLKDWHTSGCWAGPDGQEEFQQGSLVDNGTIRTLAKTELENRGEAC